MLEITVQHPNSLLLAFLQMESHFPVSQVVFALSTVVGLEENFVMALSSSISKTGIRYSLSCNRLFFKTVTGQKILQHAVYNIQWGNFLKGCH